MQKSPKTKNKLLQPSRGLRTQIQGDLIVNFLNHVSSTPDQFAIITSKISLTYRELFIEVFRWKTLFSQQLEDKVVVCLERSPRLISVLLALQWLDITYIPVDPSTPVERLQTIIEDSQAQAFLYDAPQHPDYTLLSCLQLDLSLIKPPAFSFNTLTGTYLPKEGSIAYIIYTSGSTGAPKGVVISRVALNNFLTSMSSHFLNENNSILLAITTIGFDIAALELFLPLWQQKTVFLADQIEHKDPFLIKNILNQYPISHLQATPAMWKMLTDLGLTTQSKLIALCGGEPLSQTLSQNLLLCVKELWNMYGPTEATIWCSLKQIQLNESITIGRPIENMEMCVMSPSLQILPPYVKGELYIGGLGLAEGYVNNDILTQSRFIAHPSALRGRLYAVGDIACSTSEGEFVIFGRTDNQIKLHGYRIELEDIEAHINKAPNIRECAVIAREGQLIAYLSVTTSSSFSEQQLIKYLANELPEYMLPKRFVLVKSLPLTTSGKINRKALPVPPLPNIGEMTAISGLTPMQSLLCNIWAEELGLPNVGIHLNFFELGGHSLIAARILLKIAIQTQKQISPNDFYNAPTISQLAKLVEKTPLIEPISTEKNLSLAANRNSFPMNDFQQMLWVSMTFEPQLKNFSVVDRRRIDGPINKKALDLALQLVYDKHEAFSYTISRFYPIQKRRQKPRLQWIESTLIEDDETTERILKNSFDELFHSSRWLTHPTMVVAKLFYIKNNQIELQVSMSHFISDEVSIDLFFQDLSNAYLFYNDHTPLKINDSFQSFIPHVLHQNKILKDNGPIDAAFWEQYLCETGLYPIPEKYVIRNPTKQRLAYSTHTEIPESLLEGIRQLCARNQVNLNDIICAAIALSLQICCGSETMLKHRLFMNTVKSSRNDPHYDGMVGCFLQIHPLHLDLNANDNTLISLAKQAQKSSLETTEHQRASSLVKLASIGQIDRRKKSLKMCLVSLTAGIFSILSRWTNLDKTILSACKKLSSVRRDTTFLINLNILSNFFLDYPVRQRKFLFNKPCLATASNNYNIALIEYVFDVCLLRESNLNKPFIVITANLTPEFRQRFTTTLLNIIQHEVDASNQSPNVAEKEQVF